MRVIANAIKRTINDCDKVFVMGHRFSDLDCIGAAIGMQSVICLLYTSPSPRDA